MNFVGDKPIYDLLLPIRNHMPTKTVLTPPSDYLLVSTTGMAIYDACSPDRYTRWVAVRKSDAFARKMFSTNVCGFLSINGNQLLCTCTNIRCPFLKTWSFAGKPIW